jgi:hypothetical protein
VVAAPPRTAPAARGCGQRSEATRCPAAGPVALLESQAEARLPELLPLRYGLMAVSAFAYFRGAALPMANNLAGPRTDLPL